MSSIFGILILIIWAFLFYKDIKTKRINDKLYLLSNVLSIVFFVILSNFNILNVFKFMIIQTLLILAFVDIKHLEVDPKSYKYLLIPTLLNAFINNFPPITNFISTIVVFLIFFLADKTMPSDNIGGGDIKILLILSFNFALLDVFSFMYMTLFINILLYLFLAIKNKRLKNVATPMIVSITASCFINFFPIQFILEKIQSIM